MNAVHQSSEPAWATYLKAFALAFPAVFVWVGACVYVLPKLKEICAQSGMALPRPILFALIFSDLVKNYLIILVLLIGGLLVMLEKLSPQWQLYRRPVLRTIAYCLNLFVLILLAALCVCAVAAGAKLSQAH